MISLFTLSKMIFNKWQRKQQPSKQKKKKKLPIKVNQAFLTILLEEKKTKAKKDKNAPKRAISAFFFYQKERRESLKKEQPSLDNKQIISKMSEEWNNMNDSQRIPYAKLAEQDKARYEREKKEYEKNKVPVAAPTPKATGKGRKPAKKEESEEADE